MASYQIRINERTSIGKEILTKMQSSPEVFSFEKKLQAKPAKSKLYRDLQCAFREVKEMVDGKRKRVTADEFLYELRHSNT
jgi:hypothetical protein